MAYMSSGYRTHTFFHNNGTTTSRRVKLRHHHGVKHDVDTSDQPELNPLMLKIVNQRHRIMYIAYHRGDRRFVFWGKDTQEPVKHKAPYSFRFKTAEDVVHYIDRTMEWDVVSYALCTIQEWPDTGSNPIGTPLYEHNVTTWNAREIFTYVSMLKDVLNN